MSKSNPDSAIFMEDSPEVVNKKIKKAFCAERAIEGNPILDYCKNIIFGARDSLSIIRSEENGGNKYIFIYLELTNHTQNSKQTLLKENYIPTISNQLWQRWSTNWLNQWDATSRLTLKQRLFLKLLKDTRRKLLIKLPSSD